MSPFDKDFVLGSKIEHFDISKGKIVGLSPSIRLKLTTHSYTGPLKICFPTDSYYCIGKNAFNHKCLYHVSSIDISEVDIHDIDVGAFKNVGCENKNFSEINLSNNCLCLIEKCSFQNVGHKSNYVKIIFNTPKLLGIYEKAFQNVGCGVDKVGDNREISLDFTQTPKLHNIDQYAFENYNSHTKSKIAKIIFSSTYSQSMFEPGAFKCAFGDCDQVIVNLTPHESSCMGSIIREQCFAGMRIHLQTNRHLEKICPKAIDIKYLNEGSAKILFQPSPKIEHILGYPQIQFACFLENKQLEERKQIYLNYKTYDENPTKKEDLKKSLDEFLISVTDKAKQYLDEVKLNQELKQEIENKKQVLQVQQQFILEQEQRIKDLMAQLGYFDDKELAKRLQ